MADPKKQNRRRFLKIAGGALVTATVVGGGLIAVGSRRPNITFTETTYPGNDTTDGKVLVAYASKCGSTGGVADVIGQELNAKGAAVDVRLIKNVSDATPYKAVVIGSAIRMGSWLSEAKAFVKTHQQALKELPLAYFTVCGSLRDDTEESRRQAMSYMDSVREILEPPAVEVFGGKMDYETLSFLERLIITKMIKSPEGDWRAWEAIRAWTRSIVI